MAVRKRGRIWYYDFQIRKERYRGAIPEARTKHEAEQAETKIRTELFEGRYGKEKQLSPFLHEFINETYLMWARGNKRTAYDDELTCKVICEHFGRVRLSDINPLHVERFKQSRRTTPTKRGQPRKPATVNCELTILSSVFRLAVDAGHIAANPCRKVKPLRVNNARFRYLTQEEETRLMEALESNELLRRIVVIAINTGLRRGEIFSLCWNDVDFWLNSIHVRESKTGKGRVVPMNKEARELLLSVNRDGDLIFRSPYTGNRLTKIDKGFRAACRRAELEDFHFHDLRHTFATRLAEGGADAFTIAEILGHSSLVMTKRYTHVSDERKRKAVELIGKKENGVANVSQMKIRQAVNLP